MEVSAEYVDKRPQRHDIVKEVMIAKLEVLIRFLYTLRSFERFIPIEQITVFLRSN